MTFTAPSRHREPIRGFAALLLAAVAVTSSWPWTGVSDRARAQESRDPRVPPGRDPGGVPIALVGPGVDYRIPALAARLARDGEGEPIGWDFVDNDARPFEADRGCVADACPGAPAADDEAPSPARMLVAEAGASRLIVLKTRDGERGALAAAIAFAARSPARIVPALAATADGAGPDWMLLIEAARRFSNLLFIAPAYGPPITIEGFDDMSIGNLLVVAPATAAGGLATAEGTGGPAADVAVPVDAGVGRGAADPSARRRAELAVVRVAAVAARLLATDPLLDAHAVKVRLLSLAEPAPAGVPGRVRAGRIAAPETHFRFD